MSRRFAAVVVAGSLALTACGGMPDAASPPEVAASGAALPRTVQHAMGETEIPA